MVYAIILAGGTGERCEQKLPKQFLSIGGKPVICHTIERFERCEQVDEIILPCVEDWCDRLWDMVKANVFRKVKCVLPGGASRQESIREGLRAIPAPTAEDIVVIHDGVRPMVSERTIRESIRVAAQCGAAMTVRPCKETVVMSEDSFATMGDFAERSKSFALTSPQTFRVKELLEAFASFEQSSGAPISILDAAMLCAYFGKKVAMVQESGMNPKITTQIDMEFLSFLYERHAPEGFECIQ